jgi:arabinose-5-phosphate isomerase
MHSDHQVPQVIASQPVRDALVEMTAKGFGMTAIVDDQQRLVGVFTDGDLRRMVDQGVDIDSSTMQQVMSVQPKTVRGEILAAEALKVMEDLSITALLVENQEQRAIGVLHMHDLLRAGVV